MHLLRRVLFPITRKSGNCLHSANCISNIGSCRSSRSQILFKIGVLKKSPIFTGVFHRSLFFNKAAGLRPATLSKMRPLRTCFPVNIAQFLRTSFFIEHLWWLLLELVYKNTFQFKLDKDFRSNFSS